MITVTADVESTRGTAGRGTLTRQLRGVVLWVYNLVKIVKSKGLSNPYFVFKLD